MKNKDNTFPASKAAANFIMSFDFPESRPIFWGPGQDTKFPMDYVEPDKTRWRHNEILALPKVARFIMGSGASSGEGDPCHPPGPDVYKTVLVDKRANQPPYPHDYVLYWALFRNGVNQNIYNMYYSIIPFEYVFNGTDIVLFSNWDQFTVGLSFDGAYNFAFARILYIYNGIGGPGYYFGATKITPGA